MSSDDESVYNNQTRWSGGGEEEENSAYIWDNPSGDLDDEPTTSGAGNQGAEADDPLLLQYQQVDFEFPAEAIDFSHLRPVSKRFHERHVSRVVLEQQRCVMYRVRCTPRALRTWWDDIKKVGALDHVRDAILATPFAHLVDIPYNKTDIQGVINGLVERWWDSTHTFHFPQGELGFTPLDFCMISGLSIGLGNPLRCSTEFQSCAQMMTFFPCLTEESYDSAGVRISGIKAAYITPLTTDSGLQFLIDYLSLDSDDGQTHVDEYVRAFCMYLMGVFFFPSGHSTINLGYLANFEHLHELGGIDFGGAIYCHLLRCLDRASRHTGVVSSPQMGGFVILLEVWFYEYFRAANPILTEYTDERPRLRAWHGPCRARLTSEISHNITSVRTQIELSTQASIVWRPWRTSVHIGANDCRYALFISHRRMVFTCGSDMEWYLGDRCYRQLTPYFGIPPDPPTHVSEAKDMTLEQVIESNVHWTWLQASDLVTLQTYEQYYRYWFRVSIGHLLPAVGRTGNIHTVSNLGVRREFQIGQPSQPTFQHGPVHTFVPAPDPPQSEWPWVFSLSDPSGQTIYQPISSIDATRVVQLEPDLGHLSLDDLRMRYETSIRVNDGLRSSVFAYSVERERLLSQAHVDYDDLQRQIDELHAQIDRTRVSSSQHGQTESSAQGQSRRSSRQRRRM